MRRSPCCAGSRAWQALGLHLCQDSEQLAEDHIPVCSMIFLIQCETEQIEIQAIELQAFQRQGNVSSDTLRERHAARIEERGRSTFLFLVALPDELCHQSANRVAGLIVPRLVGNLDHKDILTHVHYVLSSKQIHPVVQPAIVYKLRLWANSQVCC